MLAPRMFGADGLLNVVVVLSLEEADPQPLQAVGDRAERVGQVGADQCDHHDGGDRDQRGDQAVFYRGNAPAVIDQARQYVSHHQLFALRIGWPKLDRNYC